MAQPPRIRGWENRTEITLFEQVENDVDELFELECHYTTTVHVACVIFLTRVGDQRRWPTLKPWESRCQRLAEKGVRVEHDDGAVVEFDQSRIHPYTHLAVHAFTRDADQVAQFFLR